jgi:AraC-like DNA-binding protein
MPSVRPEHISVTNVRPAVEASRARGVTEARLSALGFPGEVMEDEEAWVSGDVTYGHMECMARREDFGGFLLDAVGRHTIASLGVVGLACKTVATVGEALACHQRFQHLTNRTARYVPEVVEEELRFTEHREGSPRPGSLLVSDYTMLVAVHLIRTVAAEPVPVLAAYSRRGHIDPIERALLEDFLGAPLQTGAAQASLVLEAGVLSTAVGSADVELADYFQGVLRRAAHVAPGDSVLVTRARVAIQDAFATGSPTGLEIGRRLGMSQRTLQRRLQSEGLRFSELVADTRMRLAEGYLADPALSLAEVAFLLGYREESSFFRSFRRWKGVTPSTWRAEH